MTIYIHVLIMSDTGKQKKTPILHNIMLGAD